jgi:hypothetical protein
MPVPGEIIIDHTPSVSASEPYEIELEDLGADPRLLGAVVIPVEYKFHQTTPTPWARSLSASWLPSERSASYLSTAEIENVCDGSSLDIEGSCNLVIVDHPPAGTTGIRITVDACRDNEEWQDVRYSRGDTQCEEICCNEEVGSPVSIANGNMRYSESGALPPGLAELFSLRYDSSRGSVGWSFGNGWFSVFDSQVIVIDHSMVWLQVYRVIMESGAEVEFIHDPDVYEHYPYDPAWPLSRDIGSFEEIGTNLYAYTESSGAITRTYRYKSDCEPTGECLRLVGYKVVSTGEELLFTYSAGVPTEVEASKDGVTSKSWTISASSGKIEAIYSPEGTWTYHYSVDTLTAVRVDGIDYRHYYYNAAGRLEEVRAGDGTLIESHQYYPETDPDHPGWAMTSRTSGEHITSIQYDVDEALLERPLNRAIGEHAVRVTWASGLYSDYYYRPTVDGPIRTVEIRGHCPCGGAGDFKVVGL